MDGRRRACIDCGIVTRRKAVSARLVVPGDRSLRKLTRWVAVWALCPGGHLMRQRALQQFAIIAPPPTWCNTRLSGVTPRNDKHSRGCAALTGRARGRRCTSLGCNAPLSTAMHQLFDSALPPRVVHYPSSVGSHAPRCARERTWRECETTASQLSGDITRGPAPVTGRCTRCVALHPLRGAAPDQNGCNAYGSGVPRSQARTRAEPGIPQRERRRPKRPYTRPGTWQAN